LAQDLLGWINLKPPSGLAANVRNAAVWDGLIANVWDYTWVNNIDVYNDLTSLKSTLISIIENRKY